MHLQPWLSSACQTPVHAGRAALISWIAQTFLQLVLLSTIIVGQNIQSAASDKRASDTYADAEAILHEALQIQHHLQAQDEVIERILAQLGPHAPTQGDAAPSLQRSEMCAETDRQWSFHAARPGCICIPAEPVGAERVRLRSGSPGP